MKRVVNLPGFLPVATRDKTAPRSPGRANFGAPPVAGSDRLSCLPADAFAPVKDENSHPRPAHDARRPRTVLAFRCFRAWHTLRALSESCWLSNGHGRPDDEEVRQPSHSHTSLLNQRDSRAEQAPQPAPQPRQQRPCDVCRHWPRVVQMLHRGDDEEENVRAAQLGWLASRS